MRTEGITKKIYLLREANKDSGLRGSLEEDARDIRRGKYREIQERVSGIWDT